MGQSFDTQRNALGLLFNCLFRFSTESPKPAKLARVDADGSVSVAAEDLDFPNGCAITADGRTLGVAETVGGRLTAFDRDAAGAGRKTLYIPTTINAGPEEFARERKSKIETVEVDVPGAGWPA